MNRAVIEARDLTRLFGDVVAVRNVSFQVSRGAIFGLLGPNGSGKSTIIRMLLGILPPSAGWASMLNRDAYLESELIKPRVGYMSQQFSLYADLSVGENLRFYGQIYGLDAQRLRDRIDAVLELTSLGQYFDQLAGTLSGGWQRRLALACALIHEPEVLFLDEPTAGIDPVARRHLWDLLFELSGRGVTLFVTTHYMDEAERCTDVGYIFMSELLVLGKPSDLKSLPEVTPAGTRRYELGIENAAEHLSQLRAVEGVRDATLFGESVHVLVDETLTPGGMLDQIGLGQSRIDHREISPSLEDVFVTLTSSAESRADDPSPATAAKDHAENRAQENRAQENRAQENRAQENRAQASNRAQPPQRVPRRSGGLSIGGLRAVLVKEFYHIRRQPITLFFMLVVPVMQTIIFGYAIDTEIENIPTVVFDLDGRRYAREFVAAMENTRRFEMVAWVHDEDSFHRALTSGRAKVGVKIPPHYSDRMIRGEQVQVQVLIDGSDSQVAMTAQSTAQLLGLNLSIQLARARGDALQVAPARDATGHGVLPIETRTRLLYNPDLRAPISLCRGWWESYCNS